MTRKMDRFDKIVLARVRKLNADKNSVGFRCAGCVENIEAAKLLRNEHNWFMRMVKEEMKRLRSIEKEQACVNGAGELAVAMLTRLTQRRR